MNRSPLHWLTSDISQWDPDICHKISWKTSQASRLYSLVTEVDQPGICGDIWNHHSVSSIVHILWAAKCTHHKKGQMVCCWKGMGNLQCGSQNHHVCHTVKSEMLNASSIGFRSLVDWNLQNKMCTRILNRNQFFHLENFVQVPIHNRTWRTGFVTDI